MDANTSVAAPLTYDGAPDTRAFWSGSLPHWDVFGRPIFLTLHVHGAIPLQAAERIRRQSAALAADRNTDYVQRLRLIFRDMETWLDRADQPPLLTQPAVSGVIRDAIEQRVRRGWWRVMEWVTMPSHVHILYVGGTVGMRELLTDFKRWTGRRSVRLIRNACELRGPEVTPLKEDDLGPRSPTGRVAASGRFWQTEWFDHWSRSVDETDRIVAYIRHNPERAGLVPDWRRWPHGSWSAIDPSSSQVATSAAVGHVGPT